MFEKQMYICCRKPQLLRKDQKKKVSLYLCLASEVYKHGIWEAVPFLQGKFVFFVKGLSVLQDECLLGAFLLPQVRYVCLHYISE